MSSYLGGTGYLGGSSSRGSSLRGPLLTPAQQRVAIQASRVKNFNAKPKKQDTEGFIGSLTPDILELAMKQIASSLVNTPAGLYNVGKGLVLDDKDLLLHGDFTPERTFGIGKAIAQGTYEDFRHPLRNPGFLAMDLVGLASGGAGTVGRLGRVGEALARGGSTSRLLEPGALVPDMFKGSPMGIAAPDALSTVRGATTSMVDKAKALWQRSQLQRQNAQREKVLGFTPSDEVQLSPAQEKLRQEFFDRPMATQAVEATPQHLPGVRPDAIPVAQQSFDLFPKALGEPAPLGSNVVKQAQEARNLFDKAPTVPEALGFDPRQFEGAPWGMEARAANMTPEDVRAAQKARAAGTPGAIPDLETPAVSTWKEPLHDGPEPAPGAGIEKIDPEEAPFKPGVTLKDVTVLPNAATQKFDTVVGGRPTGVTMSRVHKPETGVEPTYHIHDDGKLVAKVTGTKAAGLELKKRAILKVNPAAHAIEDIADIPKPVSKHIDTKTEALTEQVPAKALPTDSTEKKYQSITEDQRAATGELPATWEHTYTDADGRMVLRDKDKRDQFKVYKADGTEAKGPEWAKAKTEAIAAEKQAHSESAAQQAKKGEDPKPEDTAALDADISPLLGRLGFSYNFKASEYNVRERTLRTTLGIDTPQAKKLKAKLLPGMRKLHKQMIAEEWKEPRMRRELMKLLKDEMGDELGGKAFSMIMSVRGGSVGPTHMARIAMHAFLKAPPRKTIPISTTQVVQKKVDLPGLPGHLSHDEVPDILSKRVEPISANILASNNVLVRAAARTGYGLLQAWDNPYARGGAGNFANRALRRKIQFEHREIGRIVAAASAAGITDKAREIERKVADAEPKDLKATAGAIVDSTNQLAQIGILFLKPAYIGANLIGQMLLSLNDHSWNPYNVQRAVEIQRKLLGGDGPTASRRVKMMRRSMGEGFVSEMKTGPGASRKIASAHGMMSRASSWILDTPFRDNAFINEARRQGFTDANSIGKLMDAAHDKGVGSIEHDKFVDIARRANRNLVDYGRLNSFEKQFVRRAIFFYPWIKGATIYGARYAAEHPVGFSVQAQLGKQQAGAQAQELGDIPSYLQGSFKVGEDVVPGLGKVPTIANPSAVSILGTLGESTQLAEGLLSGNPLQGQTLGDMLTPAASGTIAAAFNIDPFTGRKLGPGEGGINALLNTALDLPAPLRTYRGFERGKDIASGKVDPTNILEPMSPSEALGRYLGPGLGALVGHPAADVALNPREASSRAAAEQRSTESKVDAKRSLWKTYTSATEEEAKRVGIKLGPDFKKSMALKAEREANLADYEAQSPAKMTVYDRLVADLSLLVRMKKIDNKQAKTLAEQYASASKSQITSFRTDLGEQFFGQAVLSAYKSYLTDAGAKVTYR